MNELEYLDIETYETLYAKYLDKRPVEQLLDLAGDLQGKYVLDLCGGGGRLSLGALARGADLVHLVDGSSYMTRKVSQEQTEHFFVIPENVEDFFRRAEGLFRYDVIFCRQAVNYWFDDYECKALAKLMNDGGTFIFNTFNKEPSINPELLTYTHAERVYFEMSWLVPETSVVYHIQVTKGFPPHVTSFRWIPPKEFEDILGVCFKIERIRNGRTDLYRCVKI